MIKNRIQIIFFICIFFINQSSFAAPGAGFSPEDHSGGGLPPTSCSTTCPSGQTQNADCSCSCSATPACTTPQTKTMPGCVCSCPTACAAGQTQNADCSCSCSATPSCTLPKVKTMPLCTCGCPTSSCTSPFVQNAACACACPSGTMPALNNASQCCASTTPYWTGSTCIACNYYKGSVTVSGTSDASTYEKTDFSRTGDTTASGGQMGFNSTLSCFDSILNTALTTWFTPPSTYARKCDTCRGTGSDGTACKTGKQYMDDCVAWYLCYIYLGQGTLVSHPSAATFYFNDSCQVISSGSIPSTCTSHVTTNFDYLYYGSSPISLIWDNGADVEGILSYVTFPLDPTKNNKSWIWKASGKTPLLVYDPEHKGVITSAEQLFGNWTFGGSKLTALINGGQSRQSSRWANGYEALKTLDYNFDGIISGEELKSLGLWFDDNQDGVSQVGEVKSLVEVNVTKLYTNPNYTDPQTGNVQARLGFEREENGRTIQGSSVDWYTQGADSVDRLHDKYFALGVIRNALDRSSDKESPTASENENKTYDIDSLWNKATELSGIWSYSLEGAVNGGRPGKLQDVMLVFTELDDNKIQGGTFTQVGVQTKALNFKNITRIVKLQGTKALNEDGTISIEFIVNNEDGSTLKNYASLSKDGKTLQGNSSVDFEKDGKPKNIKYKWKAYKFNIETLLKKK